MSSVVPQTPFNEYTGDGVSTVYPYEFQLLAAANLVVTINGVEVPSSEYVISGLGVQAGGDVTFTTAPLNLTTVLLSRVIVLERDTDYQYNGELKESTLDGDLNRLWQALQGVFAVLGGAVRAPFPEILPALPRRSLRANTLSGFDANGDPIVTVPDAQSAVGVALALAQFTAFLAAPAIAQGGAGMQGFTRGVPYEPLTTGAALNDVLDDLDAAEEDIAALSGSLPPPPVRTIPAQFAWLGIVPTIVFSTGAAQWSEDVARYAKRIHAAAIGSGIVWVDPVNGNDANAGTEYQPVKTIEYAVRTLNPSVIYCLPGEYRPFQFRSTDIQGTKLKIIVALGECVIREAADNAATVTWTVDGVYPNIYYMALTPANKAPCALLDTSRLDAMGQPQPLCKYTSLALLDASANGAGWFHDAGANRLYCRYGTGVNINTTIKSRFRLVTGDSGSRILVYGAKLLMQGKWHLEGVNFLPAQLSSGRAYLYLDVDSSVRPTVAYNVAQGLDSLGADTYCQGAWLHRNQGDNFHYTDDGGLNCRGLELNCKATFAGDISTIPTAPNTSNGSSIHGTSDICRINGFYAYNYGPDVVDTGTGHSWNIGTIAQSLPSAGNSVAFYGACGSMRLDSCSGRDGVEADVRAENCPVSIYATSYRTTSIVGTGTITAYRP